MDLNSTLCLACSSSLPPRLIAQLSASPSVRTGSKPVSSTELFLTRCCARPICPDCISRNPRLARYDPCLFCLGGVSAAGHSALQALRNVDGGVKDSDVFALGDEEDDDDDEGEGRLRGEPGRTTPPPAYSMEPSLEAVPDPNVLHGSHTESQPIANRTDAGTAAPAKYYLKGGDTLTGISLRFGVDGRTLCHLNNLPPSTLTTTPHLLHTRAFVTLPPSSKIASLPPSPPPDPIEEERRARERAQKRLQLVTKEVDWRVARAYVSIAEDSAELSAASSIGKGEKKAQSRGNEPLESRAVEQYMDDEEWEVAERRAGRTVHIPRFPLNTGQEEGSSKASGPSWWQRS